MGSKRPENTCDLKHHETLSCFESSKFTNEPEYRSSLDRDREGGGVGGFTLRPPPPPPPLFGCLKKYFVRKYFILCYLTISITYRNNLPYISLSILRFSPTNPTISDSLSLVLLLNGRLDFQPCNNGICCFYFHLFLDRYFTKIKYYH